MVAEKQVKKLVRAWREWRCRRLQAAIIRTDAWALLQDDDDDFAPLYAVAEKVRLYETLRKIEQKLRDSKA